MLREKGNAVFAIINQLRKTNFFRLKRYGSGSSWTKKVNGSATLSQSLSRFLGKDLGYLKGQSHKAVSIIFIFS